MRPRARAARRGQQRRRCRGLFLLRHARGPRRPRRRRLRRDRLVQPGRRRGTSAPRQSQLQLRGAAARAGAVAEDVALEQRRGHPGGAEARHARRDPIVPGRRGLVLALPAGDDQALLRAGERDVEKPPLLLLLRQGGARSAAALSGPGAGCDPPQRQAVLLGPQQPVPPFGTKVASATNTIGASSPLAP